MFDRKSSRPATLAAATLSLCLLWASCGKDANDVGDGVEVATASGTQLLSIVPASADIAVVIPSLGQLGSDIGNLMGRFDSSSAGAADPIATLTALVGLGDGLDRDGTLAAFIAEASSMTEPQPPFIVALPVDDYDDFVQGAGVEAGDPAELRSPLGWTLYLRRFGNYALLSPNRAAVMELEPQPADSMAAHLGGLANDVLRRSDATVLFNLETMRPLLEQGLELAFQPLQALQSSGGEGGLNDMGWLLSAYQQALGMVVRDGELIAWGLDVGDEAVGTSAAIELREGSELARLLGPGAPAASLWSRLPAEPFLVAVAMDLSGIDVASIIDTIVAAIPEDSQGLSAIFRSSMAVYAETRSAVGAWFRPGEELQLSSVTVFDVDAPETFSTNIATYFQSLDGQELNFGPMMAADGTMTPITASYTASVERGEPDPSGRRVDRYQLTTSYPEGWEEIYGAEMAAVMDSFGARDMSVWLTTTEDRVVMVQNGARELIDRVLDLEGSSTLAGDPAIANARRWRLRDGSVGEVIVNSSTAAQWLLDFLDLTEGLSVDVRLAELPPMAMFFDTAEGSAAGRLVVPLEVVEVLANLVSQMH